MFIDTSIAFTSGSRIEQAYARAILEMAGRGVLRGVGDAIVTLGAFFPIWLGTQQGFSEVHREYVWATRTFGASRRRLLVDIVVPAALPYLLHGLRIGLGLGWFCLVAAEMMGVQQGLGHAIQLFSLNLETENIFGCIFVIGVLGLTMTEAVRWIEKRLLRWHTLSVGGYG